MALSSLQLTMPDAPAETPWSALIVDDDPGVRQSLRLCLESDRVRVLGVGSTSAALAALSHGWFDVVFLDLWLGKESGMDAIARIRAVQPHASIIVITAFASFESAVKAMRLGAVDYLPKPFTPEQVRHAAARIVKASTLQRRVIELEERVRAAEGDLLFETASPVQRAFMENAARAADSDAVVLLRGESGSGKNVIARWIFENGRRAGRPFVTVHCPMLTGADMISQLFGRRAGDDAATAITGKVEQAHGGTLLLDEIGDLTDDAQARLLRLLSEHTYEREGDTEERTADIRIIATTNRALEADVKRGRFRRDLFFRLNVISLQLPGLRERAEDIVPLASHFLRLYQQAQGRNDLNFSTGCEAAMKVHNWPGNIRELRNAVERAVILSTGPSLDAASLGLSPAAPTDGDNGTNAPPAIGDDVTLQDLEKEHIARVVARAPSLEAAARKLGIDPSTLQRKRKRYGLA